MTAFLYQRSLIIQTIVRRAEEREALLGCMISVRGRESSYDLTDHNRKIRLIAYNLRHVVELPPYELCTYLAAGSPPWSYPQ